MYLRFRFYYLLIAIILIVALGFVMPPLFLIGRILALFLFVAVLADIALLWSRRGVDAYRTLSPRFSNGDENPVSIRLESTYPFAVRTEVIDEVPFVFQRRDILFKAALRKEGEATISYMLRPTERGVYGFGHVRVFVSTILGLVQRRFTCCQPQDVKVYPSYLMLRQYELLAMSSNLTEMGIKRIRRVGHNTDFDQIKDYVHGDDYRTINWRATARRHQLMVNVYQEERAQQVYQVVDKGRMMQQTFQGMTLLDYAINASLVLSYVTINKQDKAGLITFSNQFETFVQASRQSGQILCRAYRVWRDRLLCSPGWSLAPCHPSLAAHPLYIVHIDGSLAPPIVLSTSVGCASPAPCGVLRGRGTEAVCRFRLPWKTKEVSPAHPVSLVWHNRRSLPACHRREVCL